MSEELNTKGELTAEEKRAKQLACLKPLKVTEDMTEEERQRQHEIRVKGGKARAEQLKKAKNLRELTNQLFETKVSKERAMEVLGDLANDIPEEDLTNGALLIGSMLNEVLENRTTKSAEFLRDTSGQKPTTELSLTGELMTEADRSLIANMAEILQAKQP